MTDKPFQIKLNKETYTFKRLSAIAIWKRIGFPVSEDGMMNMQEMTKLAPQIMEVCCTEPSKLEQLSFYELGQIMNDPEFMEYFNQIIDKNATKK